MSRVAVIDYGMGNLRSVSKALEHVAPQAQVVVTSDPAEIDRADRVVFPGVGAMRDCMQELDRRGLRAAVLRAAAAKPFLGICLGMQMLFEHSEEGDAEGLGILPGRVVRFDEARLNAVPGSRLKVPHMGWNEVAQTGHHPLMADIPNAERFYFVHSYHVVTDDPLHVAATSAYPDPFVAAVARDNLFAVQFHPEKSQAAGLKLLANFMRWGVA